MAELLKYEVPPAPRPTAQDEWEALLETLHRTGTLRVARGLFGQLGGVSEVALTEINAPAGRNLTGALLFAAECLARVPAEDLAKVARGFQDGVARAHAGAAKQPPGMFALLKLARAPDTRRAVGGLLLILNRVGAALGEKTPAK